MSAAITPVKYAGRTYLTEFSLVIALYVVAVILRRWLLHAAVATPLMVAAKLLPIVPIWLVLVVGWRHYLRIDEFAQRRLLETLAISFGIGSCIIVSYPLLAAAAGLPKLAILWAWPTLGISWLAIGAIMSMMDRR